MSDEQDQHLSQMLARDPEVTRAIAAFERKMNEDRSTQVVLTVHQFVDLHLRRLIERKFVRPQGDRPFKLGYRAKLRLAVALGCLAPDEVPPFEVLHRVRSRFVRDLEAALREEDVHDLEDALGSPRMKALLELFKKDLDWSTLDLEHRFGWGAMLLATYLLTEKFEPKLEFISLMEDAQDHNVRGFKRVAGSAWDIAKSFRLIRPRPAGVWA